MFHDKKDTDKAKDEESSIGQDSFDYGNSDGNDHTAESAKGNNNYQRYFWGTSKTIIKILQLDI